MGVPSVASWTIRSAVARVGFDASRFCEVCYTRMGETVGDNLRDDRDDWDRNLHGRILQCAMR